MTKHLLSQHQVPEKKKKYRLPNTIALMLPAMTRRRRRGMDNDRDNDSKMGTVTTMSITMLLEHLGQLNSYDLGLKEG